MFFSEKFNVDSNLIKKYGAVDISLVCDLPLFIDPMLIFNSKKTEYIQLHQRIIKYFHFLAKKAKQKLSKQEISEWFNFSEVPNNWLGYSLVGNKGLALGMKYAHFLYNNIAFALETHNISEGQHIEKVMLLYKNSGRDKISDLTVNLIMSYLAEYTQKFAKEFIDPKYCQLIPVEKAYFNYETESFVSDEYYLPTIENEKGKPEFILLTPFDILREAEPSINRKDFFDNHARIRASICNALLRDYVNEYINKAIKVYEDEQREKKKKMSEYMIQRIEKESFMYLAIEHPELYDYYVKLRELDSSEIISESEEEVILQLEKFHYNAERLIALFRKNHYNRQEGSTARQEAINRLIYFKHIIEDCDGYKNLYANEQRISNEKDLQRLFKLVWYGTSYKLDAEVNNGRGQADFIISKGQENQNIVEFKLASNPTLGHVFNQVDIYENANCAKESIIAIFYFNESELRKAEAVIKASNKEIEINKSVFLIDCRNDNKPSASTV